MAFDDDDCPILPTPATPEEMREQAARAVEQCACPSARFGDDELWAHCRKAVAKEVRGLELHPHTPPGSVETPAEMNARAAYAAEQCKCPSFAYNGLLWTRCCEFLADQIRKIPALKKDGTLVVRADRQEQADRGPAPTTLEEMRERAALAAEQCPSAHTLPDRMFGWVRAQQAIAEKIRAIPVASSGARAPRECLDHDRRAAPSGARIPPPSGSSSTDGCDGALIVLCEHHYRMREANDERIAMNQGAADERLRIADLLRARMTREFVDGREENARLYRDLAAEILKPVAKKD